MTQLASHTSSTVGPQLLAALADAGVRHVFGIPGVHTLELLRDVPPAIELVVPRHEQGAGFMADGYARVSGSPGVCLLITGPGVTNVMTPLAQAYHDSQPLLVIASQLPPDDRTRGRLHELPDQRALLEALTAATEAVDEPSELNGALATVWQALHGARRRPAALQISLDVLGEACAAVRVPVEKAPVPAGDPTSLDRAADLLLAAQSPVLLLGGGAVDAGSSATELAELLGAPVVLTGNAAGTVPSTHPLCAGVTLPFEPVRRLLADADVTVVVGSELSPVEVMYTSVAVEIPGKLIRIDVDDEEVASGPSPAVSIVADARVALEALLERIKAERDTDDSASVRARSRGVELVQRAKEALDWTEQSLSHLPWIAAIDAALPPERIVALDSTQLAYTALHALPAYRPRSWMAPFGLGTLGPALPMAIGACLARPQAPVVTIVGDGGLMFTVAELATAAQLGLALPVIVWQSHGYAEIRDSFVRAGIAPIGCELEMGSLESLADGFGCASATARTPDDLRTAIGEAIERDRPTVIEAYGSSS